MVGSGAVVTVGVDAGVGLVGEVAGVWAVVGGVAGGGGACTEDASVGGGAVDTAVVAVRVNTGVSFVGEVA